MKTSTLHKVGQRGAIDASLLVATFILFSAIGGSFIYFSLFGSAPIHIKKVTTKTTEVVSVTKEEVTPIVKEEALPAVKDEVATTSVVVQKTQVSTSLQEEKTKAFSAFVPKVKVSEIFIGSYGTVNKNYLDGISSAIFSATGIKPTVLITGSALPEQAPLYNTTRKQFDVVPAFQSVKTASAKYGAKARFIYVVDVNAYSSAEAGKSSVWYKAEQGTNTAIMSLFDLKKISDTNPAPAPDSLVIARAQKIALHILGESVGFGQSPSTENVTCLMRNTSSLTELDNEGTGYCQPELGVVKTFFGK